MKQISKEFSNLIKQNKLFSCPVHFIDRLFHFVTVEYRFKISFIFE